MTFKKAVKAAPRPVRDAYCGGKQALEKRHRSLVTCEDTRRLTGSIDLDAALTRGRPNDNRWDYGLGYKPANGREQAVWVEVHSATTSEVSTVIRKLRWLKDWLEEVDQLRKLTHRTGADIRYVWIASGKIAIPPISPQAKRLNQSGMRLRKDLPLP